MTEIWCPVPDFPDYDISTLGNVRSWRGNGSKRAVKPKPLKAKVGTNGYLYVCLSNGSRREGGKVKQYTKYIHNLMLLTFVGLVPDGMEATHYNGDKHDNVLTNLKYATHGDNIADKRRHGTMFLGEKCNFAKLTESDVRTIRRLCQEGISRKELASRFGVAQTNIDLIVTHKTWRHVQ